MTPSFYHIINNLFLLNITLIITLSYMLKITLFIMEKEIEDEVKIFFARSKLRLEILKCLNEKPQIAIFLAHRLNKHREVISRIFLDLQKIGLAKCKNPESPSFRYYKITKKGRKILEALR